MCCSAGAGVSEFGGGAWLSWGSPLKKGLGPGVFEEAQWNCSASTGKTANGI